MLIRLNNDSRSNIYLNVPVSPNAGSDCLWGHERHLNAGGAAPLKKSTSTLTHVWKEGRRFKSVPPRPPSSPFVTTEPLATDHALALAQLIKLYF